MELVPGQKIAVLMDPDGSGKLKKSTLVYVNDGSKGFRREKAETGFTYFDLSGEVITDEDTLRRISALVIPPAWTQVWICASLAGHLQATGIDAKGRKQYRYHAAWNHLRAERKYMHLLEFGRKLPMIRKKVHADLALPGFPEQKVIALVISIMQKTLIRIGNEIYADLYHSYGLTTLQNRHVNIKGDQTTFHFIGKKGVEHDIKLNDPRLSRLLKKVKDIPGQELFQYVDSTGERRAVDSGRVNAYLHEACGDEFSAKDIRTWSGTAYMLQLIAATPAADTDTDFKKNMITLLDKVAMHLGNTRTVCRKYYVHPGLISAYEQKQLDKYLAEMGICSEVDIPDTGLSPTEETLLNFLHDLALERGNVQDTISQGSTGKLK